MERVIFLVHIIAQQNVQETCRCSTDLAPVRFPKIWLMQLFTLICWKKKNTVASLKSIVEIVHRRTGRELSKKNSEIKMKNRLNNGLVTEASPV